MKRTAVMHTSAVLAFAVIVMTAVSCVHQYPVPAEAPLSVNLVFDEYMPQGPVLTKADAEDYDVRYVIEAFKEYDGEYSAETPDMRFTFTKDEVDELDHTVTLRMMEGRYRLFIWTDYADEGTGCSPFYNADDFNYIKLNGRDEGMDHVGNNEFRDAFFGTADVELIRYGRNDPPVSCTVSMERPLSKVEFITNDLDEWITKVKMKSSDEIDISDYSVKIVYPQYMPCAYNMATDRNAWSDTNISFWSEITRINATEAFLGFDYVFANPDDAKVVMSVLIYDREGTVISRSPDMLVPLERGKVTTVKGTFLSEDPDGGVSIDPDFDGEFNIHL